MLLLPKEDLLQIGSFGKAHGIKGAVTVFSEVTPADLIFSVDWIVLINDTPTPFEHTDHEIHAKKMVCFSSSIPDRTAAESLQGQAIYAQRENFYQEHPDQIISSDLLGATVINSQNHVLGKISDVFYTEDIRMLVVNTEAGQSHLPLLDHHIDEYHPNKHTLKLTYSPAC